MESKKIRVFLNPPKKNEGEQESKEKTVEKYREYLFIPIECKVESFDLISEATAFLQIQGKEIQFSLENDLKLVEGIYILTVMSSVPVKFIDLTLSFSFDPIPTSYNQIMKSLFSVGLNGLKNTPNAGENVENFRDNLKRHIQQSTVTLEEKLVTEIRNNTNPLIEVINKLIAVNGETINEVRSLKILNSTYLEELKLLRIKIDDTRVSSPKKDRFIDDSSESSVETKKLIKELTSVCNEIKSSLDGSVETKKSIKDLTLICNDVNKNLEMLTKRKDERTEVKDTKIITVKDDETLNSQNKILQNIRTDLGNLSENIDRVNKKLASITNLANGNINDEEYNILKAENAKIVKTFDVMQKENQTLYNKLREAEDLITKYIKQ